MVYLDNAATTKVSQRVLDAMLPYLKEQYGNPGSIYGLGRASAKAVYDSRGYVASLIGASPEQIIFTSGGSEANSMLFRGIANKLISTGKKRIIVSNVEHESVLKSAEYLADNFGFTVEYANVDSKCTVSAERIENMMDSDVGLVSVMFVNNETGAVNPVKKIADICRKHGVLFHSDCVQALSSYPIRVEELGCDFVTMSAHKIHGCKGVGALYARDISVLSPLILGGSHQEFGIRGGTENVAGIVAFGEACRAIAENRDNVRATTKVRNEFIKSFIESAKNDGVLEHISFNGFVNDSYGRIVNLTANGVDAETLIIILGKMGVCVSAGSACNSYDSVPSHVLVAMGIDEDDARSSIRVSFSDENTMQEARKAASVISSCVAYLLNGNLKN